ncbi:MAG: DNA-binding protein [Lachnospiraceae bacterium]|nr:DNA-binding protein [Lachnospiraceae bacterium]MDD3617733.1 DNA-binding protein [Lachnospiraceae bacterium]
MSDMEEKMYMTVEDVRRILGVSKNFAYKIIRQYNKELEERGFLVMPGKVSTQYLAEKVYGMKME